MAELDLDALLKQAKDWIEDHPDEIDKVKGVLARLASTFGRLATGDTAEVVLGPHSPIGRAVEMRRQAAAVLEDARSSGLSAEGVGRVLGIIVKVALASI